MVDVNGDAVLDVPLSDLLLSDANVNQVTLGDAADQIDSDAGLGGVGSSYATVTLVMPNDGFHTYLADFGFVTGNVTHTKTVSSLPAMTADYNQYTISYDIVVSNTQVNNTNGSGSVGVYRLTDTLAFDLGLVSVGNHSVVYSSTGGNTQDGTLSAPYTGNFFQIVDAEQILPGTTETWTVTVIYQMPSPDTTDLDSRDCDLGTGAPANTGLRNIGILSTITGVVLQEACVPVPYGQLIIVKNTVGASGNGTFDFPLTFANSGVTNFPITTLANTGTTTVTGLAPGVYDLNETVPAGWALVGSSCDDGSVIPNVDVGLNEIVTCTFTDTREATLIIRKQTVPDMDPQVFSFSGNHPGLTGGIDDFDNSSAQLISTIVTGSAVDGVVTEAVPAGWALTDISCTGAVSSTIQFSGGVGGAGFDPGDTTVAVDLTPGETVLCTFTNSRLPVLTLVKDLVTDSGGTANAIDWTLDATGPTAGINGSTGNAAVTTVSILPGDYTLSESGGPTGYTEGPWVCNSAGGSSLSGDVLTAVYADDIVCTITNDDQFAFLALVKAVTNDNGGAAVPTNWILSAAGPTPISGAGGVTLTAVNAGEYVLSESAGPGGYTAGDWACSAGSLNVATSTLTLALGESATCQIINDDIAPTLTLTKVVITDDGGTAVPADFNLTVGGIPVVSGASNVYDANVAFALNETLLAGYGFVSITGTGCPAALGDSVTLMPGDNVTCTITNDDIAVPELTLVKTATPLTYSTVGEVISYTYDLTNSGNTDLFPIYAVTDDKAVVTCPAVPAILVPLASVTCTASYVITQIDLDAGFVTNIAAGSAMDAAVGGTPVPSNPDTETVTANTNADINLIKDGTLNDDDGTAGLTPGDTISYAFTITNTGSVTLTGITLADTVGGVTIIGGPTIASLAPGAMDNSTFTGSYTVTQADIDAGTFTNTATVTGTPPSGPPVDDPDSDIQPLVGNAVLTLVKSASPATYNSVGDVISYEYDLINAGNITLYPTYSVTDDKATVTCPVVPATLLPAASVTCTATYIITAADMLAGNVINIASGTAQDAEVGGTPVVSNDDTEQVDVVRVNLAKAVIGSAVLQGDGSYTVTYTITATNLGGGPGIYNLLDTFSPGTGITLNTATATYLAGSENSQTGATGVYPNFVTGETLGDGLDEFWTVTANFIVDPAAIDPATSACDPSAPVVSTGFYNLVTGSDTDPDLTDNDACTPFDPPSISLVKTADVATYSMVGEVINYTYLITNTGSDTLDPGLASVIDDQVSVTCPLATPLPPNGTVTCTSLHTVTQNDLNNGSITNIAISMVDDVESNDDTVSVTSRTLLPPINVPTLSWQGLLALMLLMLFAYRLHTRRHYQVGNRG